MSPAAITLVVLTLAALNLPTAAATSSAADCSGSVPVPGVGELVLNEQSLDAEGTITVTGLSLALLAVLGTDSIEIGDVTCGVDASDPAPTTTTVTTTPAGSPTTTQPTPTTSPPPGDAGPTPTTAVPVGSPGGGSSVGESPSGESGSLGAVLAASEWAGEGATPEGSSGELPEAGPAGALTPTFDAEIPSPASRDQSSIGPRGDTATLAAGLPGEPGLGPDAPWLTPVDYVILGVLSASAGLIAWKKLGIRRFIRDR